MSKTVVLLHGIYPKKDCLKPMEDFLVESGFAVHPFYYSPNNGESKLDEVSAKLGKFIDEKITSNESFSIVAFSMGGLIARHYLSFLAADKVIEKFITISTPHKGTYTAYFNKSPAIKQMRPGSTFLKQLNEANHKLTKYNPVSIWTPFDLMVLPSINSAVFPFKNIKINVLAHPLMLYSRHVFQLVKEEVSL